MEDIFNSKPTNNSLFDDDDNDDLFKSAISAPKAETSKSETSNIYTNPLVEDIDLNDEEEEESIHHYQSEPQTQSNNSKSQSDSFFASPSSSSTMPQPNIPITMSSPFSDVQNSSNTSNQNNPPAATYPTSAAASIPTTNILGSPITPPIVTSYSSGSLQTQTSINDKSASASASNSTSPIIPSLPNVISGPNAAAIAAKTGGQYIEVEVSDPRKCGDGMGSYILYKVTTRTNLRFFRKDLISVDRRFSDFLGLRDKLAEKHLPLGRIVPPAPEKDAYNSAKVKIAKDDVTADDFTEKRAAALQRFLNRVAAHPDLLPDPDFREFLELDSVLPRAKNTSALSGAGMKRLLTKVGETVNKVTFKMDETDPWFEDKTHQIENLDQQLRKLHASVEALIHHRRELTSSTGHFAKSAAILGNCEEHTSLSCALSQLSETEEKLEQLYGKQASADFYYLAETIKDYINLITVVREVFHYRVKVYQTWQQAQQALTKRREIKNRLEMTGRTDKLAQAMEDINESEARVSRSQEDFDKISKSIKAEVEKFEIVRIHDFKSNIIKYLESLLDTQQQIIKHWEAFLPEAKAIA